MLVAVLLFNHFISSGSALCPGSPSSTSTPRLSSSPAWCCSPRSAPRRQRQQQQQPSPPLTWTTALPTATTAPQAWSSTPTPPRRRPLLATSATASPPGHRRPVSPHPRRLRLPFTLLWLHSPPFLPPRRPSSTTLSTRPTACSELERPKTMTQNSVTVELWHHQDETG